MIIENNETKINHMTRNKTQMENTPGRTDSVATNHLCVSAEHILGNNKYFN